MMRGHLTLSDLIKLEDHGSLRTERTNVSKVLRFKASQRHPRDLGITRRFD
jgi:hypothetical protein